MTVELALAPPELARQGGCSHQGAQRHPPDLRRRVGRQNTELRHREGVLIRLGGQLGRGPGRHSPNPWVGVPMEQRDGRQIP